ncbi:IucA/IucC family protein [Kushneria sp. Sum13]|uniref:IucA/IucC family protein n=1 Tax=Kushneria sp. Sum13 TaxID=3459196 RepID=UPI0040452D90
MSSSHTSPFAMSRFNTLDAHMAVGPTEEALTPGDLTSFPNDRAAWRHFPRIERRVVGQLLQTLLFEQVMPFEVQPCSESEATSHRFVIPLENGEMIMAEGWLCESFALIRLDHDRVYHCRLDASQGALTLNALLAALDARTGALAGQAGFVRELEQTLLHDLQSAAAFRCPELPPVQLGADALEQYFVEAHSYHPCYKSRLGFSLEDNARFGPEFGQPLQVLWLALPSRHAVSDRIAGVDVEALIQRSAGPAVLAARDAFCQRQGLSLLDVVLVPVHPWQWREQLCRALYPEIARGEIALLGAGDSAYVPQQSIRTLAPQDGSQPYLKLAMHLTNTSSTRILARHTVTNAPRISAWLQGLVAADPDARASGMVLLGEIAGASLDERTFDALRHDRVYGALGAIWREHVSQYLHPGEQAVAFNGLSQCARDVDGVPERPFIDPWVHEYGLEPWTTALIRAASTPILHLLFAEGIGLEAHGQNIVIFHDNGWPTRAALKDFHDGVRFSPEHLTHPQQAPALEPVPASHAALNRNSFLVTDDPAAVRDYTCDAFFFIALADMAIFLRRHYGLEESRFWALTAQVIRDYQQAHPQHAERFARFDVFNADYEVEALTRRRLFGDETPQIIRVPSPLRPFAAAEGSPCDAP